MLLCCRGLPKLEVTACDLQFNAADTKESPDGFPVWDSPQESGVRYRGMECMEIGLMGEVAPATRIENAILLIRGQKVLLDADLAALYGVETKVLVKAVKRNAERFPGDFMFQLLPKEVARLRFQIGTSKRGRGGRRYAPYAFTEQGGAMLSGVLRSWMDNV